MTAIKHFPPFVSSEVEKRCVNPREGFSTSLEANAVGRVRRRRVRQVFAGVAVAALAAGPAAAKKRVDVSPYIQVSQVLSADLNGGSGGDDVLTYTSLAAGIDGSVQTQRVEAQLNYQYERRIAETRGVGDDDVHSGLGRVAVMVAPGLSLEGGALATRSRADIRGVAGDGLPGRTSNISKVYSAYVGPTLSSHVGPVGVGAAYRYGYTKVTTPDFLGVPGGPLLDVYDESHSHFAQASAGVKSGTVLPIGINVTAAWQREEAGQLDQRYDGKYVRGDVVVPVLPTLALVGGVGYEKIEIGEREPRRDGNGIPVVDDQGRQVAAANSPQRISYATDGLIWDAGVMWRPSPRTTLEARVGHRYDSTIYTGSLSWQVSQAAGLQIGVYDGIQSFGRQLTQGLAALPTSFNAYRDPFGVQPIGCAFGQGGGDSAGGCLNSAFQSINTANFRSRGIDGVFSVSRGRSQFGVGMGYARRRYYAPVYGNAFSMNGIVDQSYYAQAFASQQLGPATSIDGNVFVNYSEGGIPGAPSILSGGATGSLSHSFGRLGTVASLGIYSFEQDGFDSDLTAQALLGMSYRF